MKQNTISDKQLNAAKKSLLSMTKNLSQVIKLFSGLYGKKLEGTEGLTVEDYMAALGVVRPVSGEGEKARKGNYTPASIRAAWHEGMSVNGTCHIFRKVPAIYVRKDDKGKDVKYRVYTSKEAALSPDGEAYGRYMLTPVADDKWSVETILKGLEQGRKFQKHDDKALEAELAWEEVEHVFIRWYVQDAETKVTTIEVEEVAKAQVEFRF